MSQVLHLESSFSMLHNKSLWQHWVKDSCLKELLLLLNIEHSPNKGGKIPLDYSHYSYAGHWASRKTLRNTPGCIYLCFSTRKCTPNMFCTPVCTPWCHHHKMMLPSGKAHPHVYCVQKWSKLDWRSQRYWHFCITSLLKFSPILTIIS